MSAQSAARSDTRYQAQFHFPHLAQKPERPFTNLALVQSPAPQTNADTFGWDTAFAISADDVNKAIVDKKSSPTTFDATAPDTSCSATGTFGNWQLTGGAGVVVHMSIPLITGNFLYQGKTTKMDGLTFIVEVKLNFIPPQPAQSDTPSSHDLLIHSKATTSEPIVSVLDVTGGSVSDFIIKALMSGLMQSWLNENLDAFAHTFSTVSLNRIVDHENFKWLAPTHTSYAYNSGADLKSSTFGVLCMTEGRDPGKLMSQLSPSAIPIGARSGFLIAQERFLEKMVLPSLPKAFPGAKASDFTMSKDRTKVINTGNVKTKPVTNAGTTYYPEITKLEIHIQGNEIIVDSTTRTDIGLGTYSEVTVTSYQNIILADKPGGGQTLAYKTSRPSITDNATKTTATGAAEKIALELAALVIGLILTVLTEGAFLIIALIIIALLVGLMEALPKVIANAVGNKITKDSPSLALLVTNATAPITWPGGSDYVLTSAQLSGSLQLGGNPGFI